MKILMVGGTDYSAYYAEEYGLTKICQAIEAGEDMEEFISNIEDEDIRDGLEGAEFEILECGPIPERFINWLHFPFGDEDHQKGTNFFIIEEGQ